jgi:hypothetical protein
MVIIGKKSGQLGNRLLVFAHFIANSIEFGYEIYNPSFYDYAHYFAGTKDDFYCRYPAQKSTIKIMKPAQGAYHRLVTGSLLLYKKLGLKGLNLDVLDITGKNYQGDSFDMSNPAYLSLAKDSRVLLVRDGWLFRDFSCIRKHADQVRAFFAPAEPHAANVEALIARAKQDCDLLVGVHIRQGDYRKWQNGKYFYSTAKYAELMRRFADSQKGTRVKYLICSNAAQDESLFSGLNYTMGNNHQLEDMYAFGQCDFLIGPPSTYTMWASFYGSVPLYYIESIDAQFDVSHFAANIWG